MPFYLLLLFCSPPFPGSSISPCLPPHLHYLWPGSECWCPPNYQHSIYLSPPGDISQDMLTPFCYQLQTKPMPNPPHRWTKRQQGLCFYPTRALEYGWLQSRLVCKKPLCSKESVTLSSQVDLKPFQTNWFAWFSWISGEKLICLIFMIFWGTNRFSWFLWFSCFFQGRNWCTWFLWFFRGESLFNLELWLAVGWTLLHFGEQHHFILFAITLKWHIALNCRLAPSSSWWASLT